MVSKPARVIGSVVGTLVPLTFHPVTFWAQQMRVDMLAIFFSFLAVAMVVISVRRPAFLWLAAILFVLAVYTKQTEIVAPVAALSVSLVLNPKRTLLAALAGAGLAVTTLAILQWITHGYFPIHIILYNLNPFSPRAAWDWIGQILLTHAVYFVSAVGGLVLAWIYPTRLSGQPMTTGDRGIRKPSGLAMSLRNSEWKVILAIVTIWFILSSITLITIGKIGANENYFVEPMYVWTVPIGLLVAIGLDRTFSAMSLTKPWFPCAMMSLLAVALLWQTLHLWPSQYHFMTDREFTVANRNLIEIVRNERGPVYSDDLMVLMRSGKGVAVEPPIIGTQFASVGWTWVPFVRMIKDKEFEFLIMRKSHDGDYPKGVLSVMLNTYPIAEVVGPYAVRRPRGP